MHYYILAGIIFIVLVVVSLIIFLFLKFQLKLNTKSKSTTSNNQTDKLNFIFNSIDEGVVLIDKNRLITVFNPAASRITGWEVNEALGIDIILVIKLVDAKAESLDTSINPLYEVFKLNKKIKNNNCFILSKNNSQIAIDLEITPIQNDQGIVESAVVLLRNVTEEKLEEQKLADFISTASHEMRTPVAAIEGYLALALSNKVSNLDDK